MSPSPTESASGVLSIVGGAVVVGIGAGVVPVDPGSVHAPGWVLAVCGALCALGGVAMLAHRWPVVRTAAVGVMWVAFGLIGGWVALFGQAEHYAGGIGLLPDWINILLARGLFGFGAVLCFGLFVWTTAGLLRGAPAGGIPEADGPGGR